MTQVQCAKEERARPRLRRSAGWGLTVLLIAWLLLVGVKAYQKGLDIWLPGYLSWAWSERGTAARGPTHIMFLVADHFEPAGNREVMARWVREYPRLAARHRDHDGRPPRHTWFYPVEQMRPGEVGQLAGLCAQDLGDIGIHLHHRRSTDSQVRAALRKGGRDISRWAGLHGTGAFRYPFVHGNWGLDSSRGALYCGARHELDDLQATGCFGDFTFPTLARGSQPRLVNTIFYAKDSSRPKSYARGEPVQVGKQGRGLLIFQGPLLLRWGDWRHLLYPAIDHGDLHEANPPTPRRVDAWVGAGIHVAGRPEWVFVKAYTHGAQPGSVDMTLGQPADRMYSHLERRYNDGRRYVLHYVTAREAYNIVRAAEDGKRGDPGKYRNYEIPAYAWGQGNP